MGDILPKILTALRSFVTYGLPILSFIFSLVVYAKSRKINKMEEKLKQYELDRIEKEKNIECKACVEARITTITKNKHRIKVWNSGNAPAFEVDYDIPNEYGIVLHKEAAPFEVLEPGESFEDYVILYMGSSYKYKVITMWKDGDGKENKKEKIRSIA